MDKAYKILREMPEFNFEEFKALMKMEATTTITIYQFLEKYIERLQKQNKFSSRSDYRTLKNRLFGSDKCTTFAKKNLLFKRITPLFLHNLIAHWLSDGVKGGIWNYMKMVRKLYTQAKDEGLVPKDHKYPFKEINKAGLKNKKNQDHFLSRNYRHLWPYRFGNIQH